LVYFVTIVAIAYTEKGKPKGMEEQNGKTFGIGKKLLVYFLALSLLPTLIGGIISFQITKNQCEKNTEAHLGDLARDCGKKISYYVSARYQDIRLVSQAEVLKGKDTQAKQDYIDEVHAAYPLYKDISVINQDGIIIACTRREFIGESRSETDWFQRTKQASHSDVLAMDAYRSEMAGGDMVIGFNTPITDKDKKEVLGVLATRVNMDHIIERVKVLDERSVGDNHAYLLNRHGEIIAGPDEREFLTAHRLSGFPVINDLLAGKTGISRYTNDRGQDVISAGYSLKGDGGFDGWGWGIIVTQSTSEAFKAAYRIRNTLIFLAIGIALFVSMLAVFISRRFSRPIREVSGAALRISQGDLEPIVIDYDANDELGNLVHAFNKMAQDLHSTTVSRDALTKEIAERKWAEQAVIKNEEKIRNILHGSPIPIFVIDTAHRITYWNKAMEEYTGIKASEIVRTDHHWKAFYDKKRPCIADLLVDGKVDDIDRWFSGKSRPSSLIGGAYEAIDYFPRIGLDGTWLHFTAAPVKDFQGKTIGAVETLLDITEMKKAEERIKHLSRQIIDIQERERESIAREIHDNVGQLLSALKMALSRVNKKIPAELSSIKEPLSEIFNLLNKTIKEIRALSHALHPPLIEDLGIVSALEELCQDFKSYSEINITWDIGQIQQPLQSITKITIYRLFQEGLNNILKHSKATKAHLSLTSSGNTIHAVIEDNGIGFLVDDVLSPLQTRSLGLISIRERVALIGGDLKIESSPGKGAKLTACLEKE
jgi:signal transduction histidine kinase